MSRLQCKDIPTLPILKFLYYLNHQWGHNIGIEFDRAVQRAMPLIPEIPDKLVVAKMNKLIRKGLVDGCTCGCRGDYEITEKGIDKIMKITNSDSPHEDKTA